MPVEIIDVKYPPTVTQGSKFTVSIKFKVGATSSPRTIYVEAGVKSKAKKTFRVRTGETKTVSFELRAPTVAVPTEVRYTVYVKQIEEKKVPEAERLPQMTVNLPLHVEITGFGTYCPAGTIPSLVVKWRYWFDKFPRALSPGAKVFLKAKYRVWVDAASVSGSKYLGKSGSGSADLNIKWRDAVGQTAHVSISGEMSRVEWRSYEGKYQRVKVVYKYSASASRKFNGL